MEPLYPLYMLEILNQDYIRTARAKGLRPRRVLVNHAFALRSCRWLPLAGCSFRCSSAAPW